MQEVFLNRKLNLKKYMLLAHFSSRYRDKASLREIDAHLWSIVNSTIISNDSKYLYVKNPKAACSTVAHAFYQWQYRKEYDGNIHTCGQILQGSQNTSLVVKALTNAQVFKFSFIRNPAERAASAYNNFFVDFKNREHVKHMPFMKRLGFEVSNNIAKNFDVFLDYLVKNFETDLNRVDPHFRPQFYNLRPDLISYDFLGRVESLDRDIKAVMDVIKVSGPALEQAPVGRKNVSRGGYSPTSYQVKKLEDIFSKDYELFEGFSKAHV